MQKDKISQLLQSNYGFLFEKPLIEEIATLSRIVKAKEGEIIIDYNQTIRGMPLMVEGAIKISRQDNDGDELALYYLELGDTCTMTMTCCMGTQKSQIKAVAETEVIFLLVPIDKMKEWIKKYNSWLTFVFDSYNNRFNELLDNIDNLAFNNMQERLSKYIKDQVMIRKTTVLELSHQDIAYDLHTSRVVVSRLLKGLEKTGEIELGRNKILVINY